MLWARSPCKLAGSGRRAGESLPGTCRAACRPAIENRLATLQPRSWRWCGWCCDGCFVHWPRPGLRHHHPPRRGRAGLGGSGRTGCGLGGDGGNSTCRSAAGSFGHMRRNRALLRHSCGRSRSFNNWRNSSSWCLNGDLLFARSGRRGRLHDNARRRGRDHHNRARRSRCPCWSFGDYRASGRTRSNGWSGRRRRNDGRRGARRRSNLPRFRPDRRGCSGLGRKGSSGCGRCGLGRGSRSLLGRNPRVVRLFFFLFLLCLQRFQNIARLGNVRKIDLGNDGLYAVTPGGGAGMGRMPGFMRKVRTNLFRLVQFEGTGVRLAPRYTELRKDVENCS